GGMGTVWKAWDKKLTRWVAIKFLLATEEEDIARFQREAKLAARLRHPNIAPIYEVGEAPAAAVGSQARHYLAMEFIDGMSMASATNLPINELIDIFMKVAQGMEAAHKAGVVHRDLKPQNIMLTSDKWPYVMDFGLAKALQAESSLSVSGAVMGTPAYMPPEQAQGQLDQVDGQSDVYSLGATMYSVLCKKQPFTGQTPMEILMKLCKEDPVPPRKQNPEIPEAVEKIILKAMAKEKIDRYTSALMLADDLKKFLNNEEISARGPSSLKLAARRAKKNVWPIVALLLVVVGGGTIAFLLTRPKPEVKPPDRPADTSGIVTRPPPADEDPAEKAKRLEREKADADRQARLEKEAADRQKKLDEEAAAKKAQEAKEAAWLDDWLNKIKPGIAFSVWKPGDAALADLTKQAFKKMATDASKLDALNAVDFVRSQVQEAVSASTSLGKDRERALRLIGWCEMITAASQGIDRLKPLVESLVSAKGTAVKVTDYKGTFTLQLQIGPFAEITRFSREGKDLPLSKKFTPLKLPDLEIGEYDLELTNPQLGKKQIRFGIKDLKDGRTYLISGQMSDPGILKPRELP
ncbi:MAG TPA: serine/threonine-protein kinase, partial [Planctomycetota bacterium]|nr:serine/threonine-protein kinase [Planctomycetota bacterium]